ncbi:MAG: MBL fold metallo-hydrolase [Lachnospiraceae bacterium]|nr:MBL fold metallo-hydrolase [Lachnospiraceae bacterium]
MKIVTLIENTDGGTGLHSEHGLSVYIETEKHKVLVDAGSSEKACENAKSLGIDLSMVDSLVLSHGHYDHSGGILPFTECNCKAHIYMQKSAGYDYVADHDEKEESDNKMQYGGIDKIRYIGIDKKILSLPQLRALTMEEGEIYKIDDELQIFSGIKGNRFSPKGNSKLYKLEDGQVKQDDFVHEECLAVFAEGKKLLFSGCAHNGIVNILDRYKELYGCDPDYVFSGFHMMKDGEYDEEDLAIIKGTAEELKKKETVYYSGHCTSQAGFDILKEILGEQLQYMHSGTIVNI